MLTMDSAAVNIPLRVFGACMRTFLLYVLAWIFPKVESETKCGGGGLVAKLCPTPQTVACQSPLSMGFPRQGYWSSLPFPSPGDLPDPRIEPRSPAFQADALTSELSRKHKSLQI